MSGNGAAPLRIGILGAARIAPLALIKPAKGNVEVVVAAVAARDAARAQAFAAKHGIARVDESYETLIADPDLDAIYIPLPNGLHGRWIRAALGTGKHVLPGNPTVKPVTLVVDAILDCSKRGGIILDVFAGSGTTLIAAEKAGRRGYGIEIDCHYADIIIRRFDEVLGLKAVHAESKLDFERLTNERFKEKRHGQKAKNGKAHRAKDR